jgi:hypothetical protein
MKKKHLPKHRGENMTIITVISQVAAPFRDPILIWLNMDQTSNIALKG